MGLPASDTAFGGERDGAWQIMVSRQGGGELSAPLPAERFFLTTVIDGGPYMRPLPSARRYYTGDTLNPLVQLRHPNGARVHAEVTLEVELPGDGTGNILTTSGLRKVVKSTATPRRWHEHLDRYRGRPRRPHREPDDTLFELFDDGEHSDGAIEPDGIFGNLLSDLTRVEGNYTFRALAEFGDGCTATRETFWSAEVAVGIDPGQTLVSTAVTGTQPDGSQNVRVTVTPGTRSAITSAPDAPASSRSLR